jgi:hypothetical protein
VLERALDHRGELIVALRAFADVSWIDAVLGEGAGAVAELLQQLVAVVMEVADERHAAAARIQPLADRRHLGGRLGRVHGDAHQLRARARERLHLARRRLGVGGVGIRHRLHDDGRAAADDDVADRYRARGSALHLILI